MNWDREIEIGWDSRVSGWISLADLLDWALANLTREEAEELGGEFIKFAELSPVPLLLGD